MEGLDKFLKPAWGAEKWILEGWDALNGDEQRVVTERMDALFSDGLPFQLKHDRMLYIYAFSLLAQLEVLAIQVPLKFEAKMPTLAFKQRMRVQLIDEVFHGMVFTRILYELITPYAMPPAYNEEIEALCNFIRDENCPKVAVVLLNLVAEAWIEELFRAYAKADIASDVFAIILEDEHRHVCEADLYREIGLPEQAVLSAKLTTLEEKLLSGILLNYPYMSAMTSLLGMEQVECLFNTLHEKHQEQLHKLNLTPGQSWCFLMQMHAFLFPKIKEKMGSNSEIDLSTMRQLFMTQWKPPTDPTMVGEFDINVTRLMALGRKKGEGMISVLMLQTISRLLFDNPYFNQYLSYQKVYQSQNAMVGLVVSLPGCDDQLGMIIFENCHELSTQSITKKIIKNLKMMVYCHQKRLALEQKYPQLRASMDQVMHDMATGVYPYPASGNSIVSLSNMAPFGYSRAKSPLCMDESIKLTVLSVERKPVWNEVSETFEPEDRLPVSLSADHRLFNAGFPVVSQVEETFDKVLDKMLAGTAGRKDKEMKPFILKQVIDEVINIQPEVAYKLLLSFQTIWPDFIDFNDFLGGMMESKQAENAAALV